MESQLDTPGPVALWARSLAWIIVLASTIGVVGVPMSLLRGRQLPWQWYQVAPFLIASLWLLPLFWIVAITGRPPKRWIGLGTQHWKTQNPPRKQ